MGFSEPLLLISRSAGLTCQQLVVFLFIFQCRWMLMQTSLKKLFQRRVRCVYCTALFVGTRSHEPVLSHGQTPQHFCLSDLLHYFFHRSPQFLFCCFDPYIWILEKVFFDIYPVLRKLLWWQFISLLPADGLMQVCLQWNLSETSALDAILQNNIVYFSWMLHVHSLTILF